MNLTVQFPPIDTDCSLFLAVGVPIHNLPKEDLIKLENEMKQLREIRDYYGKMLNARENLRKPYQIYTVKNFIEVKRLNAVLIESSENYYAYRHQIYLKLFNIVNQLLGVMEICRENHIQCSCDVSRFQAYAEDRIKNKDLKLKRFITKRLTTMRANLNKADPAPKKGESNSNVKTFLQMLQTHQDEVNMDIFYIPYSEIDEQFFSLVQSQSIKFDIDRILKGLKNRSTAEMNKELIEIQNQLNITVKEHKVILKCVFIRYCFEIMYEKSYGKFRCPSSDKFLNKCLLIGSYSPYKIGLCENPFTHEQYNTPIMNLLQDLSLKSIVDLLSTISYYTNPYDMIANITIALRMLGDFARSNDTYRRLGRFASMASDIVQKKSDMLSFDDCFSLFFVTFVMHPPCIAPMIASFLQEYDLGYCQQMKYSRDIFIASVKHVVSFNNNSVQDDLTHGDPLGIISD